MDLFACDRSPEEALEQVRRARLERRQSGGGGVDNCDGDGLSKSGTLEHVMARLQLQSHMNQVRPTAAASSKATNLHTLTPPMRFGMAAPRYTQL